jgi:hypothetical protein
VFLESSQLGVLLCLEVRPAKAARCDALELLGHLLGAEVSLHLGGILRINLIILWS